MLDQELEFLADTSVITPQQLSSILTQLPSQTALHAPLSSAAVATTQAVSPTAAQMSNISLNEKQNFYAPSISPVANLPPPAYASNSFPIASASAMYAYTPSDAGDLAISPNDRIAITEFMNADWAKGRNERTGQEGIFPRSYVTILDEKSFGSSMAPPRPSPQQGSSYGNMPLEVSQSGGGGGGSSKFDEQGKKFGKKLGNAGMFPHSPAIPLSHLILL